MEKIEFEIRRKQLRFNTFSGQFHKVSLLAFHYIEIHHGPLQLTKILRHTKTKFKGLLTLITDFSFLKLGSEEATSKEKTEDAY